MASRRLPKSGGGAGDESLLSMTFQHDTGASAAARLEIVVLRMRAMVHLRLQFFRCDLCMELIFEVREAERGRRCGPGAG